MHFLIQFAATANEADWASSKKDEEAYGAKNGLFAWVGSYQDNLHNDMLSKVSSAKEAKPIFLGCDRPYLHSV